MATAPVMVEVKWLELDEVDSTNAEAMRRAIAGERGPLYVRADSQIAGRGRSGREWSAPRGNLALSRLGRIDAPLSAIPQLSLVAGVAVYRAAVEALSGGDETRGLQLKWPNDILLGGAKLAGILVEATTLAGDLLAVIGIGVNVAHAPKVQNRRTAALADNVSGVPDVKNLARRMAHHLEDALAVWDESRGFEAIRNAWLSGAIAGGTAMTIWTPAGQVSGLFQGLDSGGALILAEEGGGVRRFTHGDVTLASEWEMS